MSAWRSPGETIASQPSSILFLLPSLGGGGAERVMVSIVTHLSRTRFVPHVAVLEKTGPYVDKLPRDVPLHELGSRRVRYALPGLVRLAWKLRPATVLSNIAELNIMLILARSLLPHGVRLLVRETILVSAWLAEEARLPRILGALYPRVYPRADGVICQCDAMMRDLEECFGVPRGKLVRIYNPVDFGFLRTMAEAGPSPYSGPRSGPHLLASGRLTFMKGFDLLLEAMSRVVREFPAADLTILGRGPLEGELKALAERLHLSDRVRFPGYQLNPYPWVKHADMFVLSSRYEGLPNVMLEALALGTPVVGTDCPGGVREILENCRLGRLAPGVDAHRLAETVIGALRADLRSQGAGGLDVFLDRFRLDRIVRQYEEALAGPSEP
ncbi:MAG TPA: glycosyltransferase [Terriglobia bacterium]|nr:glycosyltransferase [Terriglobia bacterium]